MHRIGLVIFMAAMLLAPALLRAETVTIYNPSGLRLDNVYVDTLLDRIVLEEGLDPSLSPGQVPNGKTEEVAPTPDLWVAVNDLFLKRGWTDGLPIVPPTADMVQNMLKGTDLPGDFEIAVLAPMNGMATVEKIAVNAVMAGCSPAHMPFIIAAVECLAHPEFDLRGMSTTTNPDTLLLIISGPNIKDLGVNYKSNVFGRGNRANLAMSRALHLILNNVGGSRPGVTDMSTLGQPAEIGMFLAENPEATPWAGFNTQLGFPLAANAVTVAPVESYLPIRGSGFNSEAFLRLVANTFNGQDRVQRKTMILLLAQDTAGMLHKNGWNPAKMVDFIRQEALVPLAGLEKVFRESRSVYNDILAYLPPDATPETLLPRLRFDKMLVLVTGGVGEKSMLLPCWASGRAVSQQVRLPRTWKEIIEMR